MKRTMITNRSWGAWAASAFTCLAVLSASGQLTVDKGPIVVPDYPALPSDYPSVIKIKDTVGTLDKVAINLNTVSHSYANDLKVMLVAPNGKAVVLMSGAGGGQPLAGVTIVFDDKGTALPRYTQITEGAYKPANYGGATFVGAPVPNATTLAELATQANGDWKLYVADDAPYNNGAIASWTLKLYTAPTIALSASTLTFDQGKSGTVDITLNDSSSRLTDITLSAVADDQALIPTKNLTFTGTGATRTLKVEPGFLQSGTTTVRITAKDESSSTVTALLTVNVTAVNQPPVLSLGASAVTVVAGEVSAPVTAFLSDPDSPIGGIVMSASSSDDAVVNPGGLTFATTPPGARPFTVLATTTTSGSATLTVKASDGASTASQPLFVNVLAPAQPLFGNYNAISLGAGATVTSPTIAIPAISGNIGRVVVSLNGVRALDPAGLKITLKSPVGDVVLLNGVATTAKPNLSQLTFRDGATGAYPTADSVQQVTIPPTSPLSTLVGKSATGNWSLLIENAGSASQIAAGWQIKVFTAPTIGPIADQKFAEDGSADVLFTVADLDGTVTKITATVPAGAPVSVQSATVNDGRNARISLKGNPDAFGITTVTVTAFDNMNQTVTKTFQVEVTPVNDAPNLVFIEKQIGYALQPIGPINLIITDVDTPASSLVVTATSDNPKVLPDANIVLQRSGSDFSLTLFPTGLVAGDATVDVTVSDGEYIDKKSFTLHIQGPANPLFQNSTPIVISTGVKASPYVTTNKVETGVGDVAEVQVTLMNFSHQAPRNVKVLLVGPNGNSVVLMANVGGVAEVNNLTVTLADSAAATIPAGSIASGVYKPSLSGTVSFPDPAPMMTPTHTSLAAAFNGINPKGDWRLYVYDDGTGKSNGTINGGWVLSIRTAPFLNLADQEMDENTTKRIAITVGDDQPGVATTVTAVAADTDFIPSITIEGTGGTRTLVVTPKAYYSGSTTITVTASDTLGNTATDTFTLTVKRRDLDPVISTIADVSAPATQLVGPIPFTAWSPQADTDPLIKIEVSSDNPGLFPNGSWDIAGPTITPVVPVAGPQKFTGGVNSFTITLQPAGIQQGSANITITATDITKKKSSRTFKVTITPSLVYAYEKPMEIPLGLPIAGEAVPYGAPVDVSGLQGLVNNVKVTLLGFRHTYPDDVNVLLVAPDNKTSVLLMSHVGGGTDVERLRLNFSDDAGALPNDTPLTSGTYKPTAYGPQITLPAPAPAPKTSAGYPTTLSEFRDVEPNGTWRVYVLDDAFPDGGAIDGGVLLSIETKPRITDIADQTSQENAVYPVQITIANSSVKPEDLRVYAVVTAQDPANLVLLTNFTGTGSSRTLWITNAPNLPSAAFSPTVKNGTANIQIVATNAAVANGAVSKKSFKYTVVYVNQPPEFTDFPAADVQMDESTTKSVLIKFKDVDTKLTAAPTLTITSDNSALFPSGSVVVEGFPAAGFEKGVEGSVTIKMTPAKYQFGKATIMVSLDDKGAPKAAVAVKQFVVDVKSVFEKPTITKPADFSIAAGTSKTGIAVKVTSNDTDASKLVLRATSSNKNIIPDEYIKLGGSGENRTVAVTSIGNGAGSPTATINLTVTDPASGEFQTTSFVVTVTPPAPTVSGQSQFADINPIVTDGAGKAAVYPALLEVPVIGMSGKIFKVTAMLDGFKHEVPSSLDVMLVHPNSTTAVMLMSGAGDAVPVADPIRLTFDDAAATDIPADALVAGTFKPHSYTKRKLPDAPETYTETLSTFKGLNASGVWRLYVNNQSGKGNILAGWKLGITTAPTITLAPTTPITILENGSAALNVTIKDDYGTAAKDMTVTVTSSNPLLMPSRAVTPADATVLSQLWTARPELYQNGKATLTFTVTRKSDGATASITAPEITVTPVNFPPYFSRIPDLTVMANKSGSIQFLVTDGDTPLQDLVITATSQNQSIVKDVNLRFNGDTNTLYGLPATAVPQTSLLNLSVIPELTANGATRIDLKVTEKGTEVATGYFFVTVEEYKIPPVISTIPTQVVASGATVDGIPFTVTSDAPGATFTVTTADSPDSYLDQVVATQIGADPTKWSLRIVAADIITDETPKTSTVTLTATANNGAKDTEVFTVTIIPKRERSYTNSTPIAIRDNDTASPYPSTIKVDDLSGAVKEVKVRLNGFSHTFPADVAVLLVSPSGQSVVLMNRAGQGGGPANDINLTFSQNAATAIPNSSTLTTGTYKPADYRGGTYNFAPDAPAGPYGASLASLTGAASGTWSLYVMDDARGDSGSITRGWTLSITTEPIIKGLADQTIQEGKYSEQAFTIADDTRSANPTYQISATSSKPSVIPVSGITFGGTGTNRTIRVTPVSFGDDVEITVFVTNGDGQTVSSKFMVDVIYTITPPSVGEIADATVSAGSVFSIPVAISDAHTPYNQLKIGITSSNEELVPVSAIKLANNTLTITPVGALTGASTITLSVTNKDALYTVESFVLTVTESPVPLFANTGVIQIKDLGKANPYPSQITVPALGGTIQKATVTLNGLRHTFPQDISILLAAPSGTNIVLMSRAGGAVSVTGVRLVLDSTAANPIPQSAKLVDGTYRPSNYKASDFYDAPAPIGPYSKTLDDLIGTDPMGTWSLYVKDEASPDGGAIEGGWTLTITTSAGKAIVVGGRHARLTITQIGEDISLTVSGTPGVEYGIETSTDMSKWSEAASVTANDNGTAVYTIKPAKSGLQLFRATAK